MGVSSVQVVLDVDRLNLAKERRCSASPISGVLGVAFGNRAERELDIAKVFRGQGEFQSLEISGFGWRVVEVRKDANARNARVGAWGEFALSDVGG